MLDKGTCAIWVSEWAGGKLPWWAIACAGEHVVQDWVLVRPDKVTPPIC